MRIFITGSSSCLALTLLPILCSDKNIDQVVGIDIRPPNFTHPKFRAYEGNFCTIDLAPIVRGVDAIIHLGYAVSRDALSLDQQRNNNVNGTIRIFETAEEFSVARVINLSSVSVYGSGRLLDERNEIKPHGNFPYAQHKAEVERLSQKRFPDIVHLRSHFIVGKNCQPFLKRLISSRLYFSFRNSSPKIQVVHEEDIARAIHSCLESKIKGAVNLAAPSEISIEELVRYKKWAIPIPVSIPKALVSISKNLGAKSDFTWLDVMETSLTVNCNRAKEELNWTPSFDALEAISKM